MGKLNTKLFNGIFNKKKVLLTGDTGFKGSWLSIWLKELGAEVYGYSLDPKSQIDNFVICNLDKKINHKSADICDLNSLKSYFTEVSPDFAFHLAAQALVLDSYIDPHTTFFTNLMGTVNFFEAVRCTPSVKVAINVTSDKCYQNNEWVWGYRENDPMGGVDPYSASKGCSELISNSYLKSFFNQSNLCKIATARAGNVIGGGDWATNRIIPDFFRAVQRNEKLVIRHPMAIRPWQHVLEPLSGYLWLCAQLSLEGEKFTGGWNFGPLESNIYSVKELITRLIKEISTGNYIIPESVGNLHEANLLKLDISKSIKYLRWRPSLDFNKTIAFTAKGYRDEITFRNSDVYKYRVDQILSYVETANEQNQIWAGGEI